MKLSEFLTINQGHQITDEEIYLVDDSKFPIYTAKNTIKGYWNQSIIKQKDLPCLSYPTKANQGDIFLQDKLFDANNTAVLIIKEQYKTKVDLEWLLYKLRPLFLQFQTSKGGVSYLNKAIVNDIELFLPNIEIQLEELEELRRLESIKNKIYAIQTKINNLEQKHLVLEYKNYQEKELSVKEIFNIYGGDSGLTEEYLYSCLEHNNNENIFLTGSSNSILNKNFIGNLKLPKGNKNVTIHNTDGIHIIRKGKAGTITYLEKNSYVLNDDAYLITLKKNNLIKVDLEWLYYTQKELFLNFSTSSDNGTWSKTGFLEYAKIDIPSINEQRKVKEIFKKLTQTRKKIEDILIEINKTFSKDLI